MSFSRHLHVFNSTLFRHQLDGQMLIKIALLFALLKYIWVLLTVCVTCLPAILSHDRAL